ncbi:MAG: type II toxin-antitoxin system RatA family toxin [Paracoccaceae bacterium]
MKSHIESCIINCDVKEVFDVVADIESYPEFLPWCIGAKITDTISVENGIKSKADLTIAFGRFREIFSSNIVLNQEELLIEIYSLEKPFKILDGRWTFLKIEDGCRVNFEIKFEFKSLILDKLIGLVFYQAIRKVVSSFQKRISEKRLS